MTLKHCFDLLATQPTYVLAFFGFIPVIALFFNLLSRKNGHLSPWKYIFSLLIYLVSIPGIFAIALSVYLFLFERRSIMQTDVLVQIVPVLSILATIGIIKAKTSLRYIPGVGKLFGLSMMIATSFAIMWGIDRTRIVAFTYIPAEYLLGGLVGLFVVMWLGWKLSFGKAQS